MRIDSDRMLNRIENILDDYDDPRMIIDDEGMKDKDWWKALCRIMDCLDGDPNP